MLRWVGVLCDCASGQHEQAAYDRSGAAAGGTATGAATFSFIQVARRIAGRRLLFVHCSCAALPGCRFRDTLCN